LDRHDEYLAAGFIELTAGIYARQTMQAVDLIVVTPEGVMGAGTTVERWRSVIDDAQSIEVEVEAVEGSS
jgi:hypothetical protein